MTGKSPINLLWISLLPPRKQPGDAGSRTLTYYFNGFIKDPRFKVKLVSFSNRDIDEVEADNSDIDHVFICPASNPIIQKLCNVESITNPWTRFAGLLSNNSAYSMISTIDDLAKTGYEPDVCILDWTQIVVLADEVKKRFPKCELVASEVDVTFIGYKRKYEYAKGIARAFWRIRYYREKNLEISSLKQCSLVMPQNAENSKELVREGVHAQTIWPLTPFYNKPEGVNRNPCNENILFYGAMGRKENYLSALWFIDNVMPLLDEQTRFIILGSNPPEKLLARSSDRIIVLGYVDCIQRVFSECLCLVAPLVLGAGIKVKILEALSSGLPVITNEIGIEGIPAKNGQEYIHCQTPFEYAAAIKELTDSPALQSQLSKNALRFMATHFDYETASSEYREKVLSLCHSKQLA